MIDSENLIYASSSQLDAFKKASRWSGLECFVNEYIQDFDRTRALAASRSITGVKTRWNVTTALVGLEINRKLQEHDAESKLNAGFIRDFIWQVLDFKPLDYFIPCPGGGWLVTQVDYDKLPDIAKKLIEDIEYRVIRGEHYLAIKMVSKTKALELACRYTLTQKIAVRPEAAIPWDQVAAAPKPVDTVEQQLAEMEQKPMGVSSNGQH